MSLILDALRKSEAQRRRGELPALSLELPPPATRPSPSRAWWIVLPIGIALAALAIWLIGPSVTPLPEPEAQAAQPPQPIVARPTKPSLHRTPKARLQPGRESSRPWMACARHW